MREGFYIVGKIIATVALIAAILLSVAIAVAFTPFYLLLIVRGKGTTTLLLQIIPIALLGSLIWRLWSPDWNLTRNEKAFFKGVQDGQEKGAYREGERTGLATIAYPEDLSLKPIYETRGRGKKNV